MEDKLKHLRSTLDQTVFREDHFTEKSKNRVREKMEKHQKRRFFNLFQQINNWFKPLLAVAVCLFLLIGTIYIVEHQRAQKLNISGDDLKADTKNHQDVVQSVTQVEKESITKLAKKFKIAEYEVDYHKVPSDVLKYMAERCRPFLTVEAYQNLYTNENFKMQSEAAVYFKSLITVEDMTFSGFQKDEKDGSIDFDYKMKLLFKQQQGAKRYKTYKLSLNGQMTVIHTKNGWKISRDQSEKLPNVLR